MQQSMYILTVPYKQKGLVKDLGAFWIPSMKSWLIHKNSPEFEPWNPREIYTYILNVQYMERDKVKAMGALWNPNSKLWFVEKAKYLANKEAFEPYLKQYASNPSHN